MIPVRETSTAADVWRLSEEIRRKAFERNRRALASQRPKRAPRAIAIVARDEPVAIEVATVAHDVPPIDLRVLEAMSALSRPGRRPPLALIFAAVCEAFDVTKAEMMSDRRHYSVQPARRAFAWLAKQLTHCSLPQIGAFLGGRDHTTILSALRRAEFFRGKDPDFLAKTDALKTAISTVWGDRAGEVME